MPVVLKINTKNNKVEQSVQSILVKVCKELEKFWDMKLKYEPVIFLLESREEINVIRQQNTDDRLVGWFWNKRFIFILAPGKFKKESVFLKKDFETILKHELSHFFFFMVTQGGVPAWMDEGLACYLAGQNYQEKVNSIEIKKLTESFYDFDRQLFAVSSQLIQRLIKIKGKDSLVDFIKSLNKNITEKSFKILFKKSFNIEFSERGVSNILK